MTNKIKPNHSKLTQAVSSQLSLKNKGDGHSHKLKTENRPGLKQTDEWKHKVPKRFNSKHVYIELLVLKT